MKELNPLKKHLRAVRWDGAPVLVALVALCTLFYLWTALRLPGAVFSPQPIGYYGLLTSGFRAGHLHVPIEPHPALLALPNPYDPVANAPYRVHDMSLWQGKYYLYFGPTPVLIWFWPVVALTGHYPSEALGIAVFLGLGLAVAATLLAGVRKHFYPSAPAWLVPLGVLVVGVGSPAPMLAQAAEFYHVPIAAAYALHLLMVWALFRALVSDHRSAFWLAAASLAYGMAVGARPNYVFTGLAIVMVWLAVILRKSEPLRAPVWRFRLTATFAAALPAAICGGSLMLYNWLRFGSVSELGIHFQLAGSDQQAYQPFVFDNLLPSAAVYLWGKGNWTPYFPFFAPAGGAIPGLFRYLPWAWLSLGALFLIGQPAAAGIRRNQAVFAWSILAAALANLIVLCVFSGINERYASDLHPSWLLLGGVGALAAMSSRWPVPRWFPSLVLGIAGVCTILVGAATFYTRLTPRQGEETWARVMNLPTHWWERATGAERGALWMELELPIDRPVGYLDPVFETGRTDDQRNWLHLEYLEGDRARVGFFHAGLGVIASDEFAIPADRRLVIEVQCGSLLPPFAHPVFSGLSRRDYEAVRRNLSVKVGGVEVLRTLLDCYEASPNDLRLGGRGWLGGNEGDAFLGTILSARRLPLNVTALPERVHTEQVPIDLEVQFPSGRAGSVEPLLASGEAFSGDLLYVSYEADNHIRFGFDHYGSGGPRSLAYRYDPATASRLTVWFGSWVEPETEAFSAEGLPWSRRLIVLLDGEVVLNTEQNFVPASLDTVILGYNVNRHSTAGSAFSGRIARAETVGFDQMPPLNFSNEYGAVEMTVLFPDRLAGIADPLVVTGETGAGNLVYVRYVDAGHVRLGFDHWGIGGVESDPIPVDYSVPHLVRITMGSLYPDGSEGTSRSRVRVEVDGEPAIDTEFATHPTRRAAIRIGMNPIGGSTCGERFNGRILSIRRDLDPR